MTSILPVSDLKNYSDVLGQCDHGAVVYLTKNGRGKYVVQKMEDYEKLTATVELLGKLARGLESARNEGTLTVEEAFAGLED